jgi:hypothetical protein
MSELYNLLVDSHHGDYSYYLIPHAKPLISGGITPKTSVDNMRTFVRQALTKPLNYWASPGNSSTTCCAPANSGR